jgi:hypothetical protein
MIRCRKIHGMPESVHLAFDFCYLTFLYEWNVFHFPQETIRNVKIKVFNYCLFVMVYFLTDLSVFFSWNHCFVSISLRYLRSFVFAVLLHSLVSGAP